MVAGLFAGIAGALYAFSKGSISPETLSVERSVDALVMVLLGGVGSIWGSVLGAVLLTYIGRKFIPNTLDSINIQGKLGLDFSFADLSFGIFGFLLVFMMLLRPQGLLPERRRKMELTEGIGTDESVFEVRA